MFDKIFSIVGVMPGRNEGVGNYVVNPEDNGSVCWSLWSGHPRADFSQLCYAYQRQVNLIAELYANPTFRTGGRDQGQLGHVLPDAGRPDL